MSSSTAKSADYPDIDPANQGGGYSVVYDDSFVSASQKTGVPFALIKAHAIRESSLDGGAYHYDNPKSGASYGLMQVEWVKGTNRLAQFGYPDDKLTDGSLLYDFDTNAFLGASIIKQNLDRFGNLRDAINAYNTGATEAKHQAPANYVDDVVKYYSALVNRAVT